MWLTWIAFVGGPLCGILSKYKWVVLVMKFPTLEIMKTYGHEFRCWIGHDFRFLMIFLSLNAFYDRISINGLNFYQCFGSFFMKTAFTQHIEKNDFFSQRQRQSLIFALGEKITFPLKLSSCIRHAQLSWVNKIGKTGIFNNLSF